MHKVDVVVCALNESKTIADVVGSLKSVDVVERVIVVDDGSTDNTAALAAAAGAYIVRLETNVGKASAMRRGLAEVTTDDVLFWDADLLGITDDTVFRMLDPHLIRRTNMTVGVIQTFGQKVAPEWSGQRLLAASAMREFFDAHPELARFSVEREITEWAKEKGWQIEYIPLPGIKHLQKEQKRGFLKGFYDRLAMYWEILFRK
jgi:polyisoprenyl-phosphate glycosyltransferase